MFRKISIALVAAAALAPTSASAWGRAGGSWRQANPHAMIRRRAGAAGIKTQVGNHTLRATGITAYLKNGGSLENAAAMANHASTRTAQLRYEKNEFRLA
jgi:integrase